MPDVSAVGDRKPPYSIIVSTFCAELFGWVRLIGVVRDRCKLLGWGLLRGGLERCWQDDYRESEFSWHLNGMKAPQSDENTVPKEHDGDVSSRRKLKSTIQNLETNRN